MRCCVIFVNGQRFVSYQELLYDNYSERVSNIISVAVSFKSAFVCDRIINSVRQRMINSESS